MADMVMWGWWSDAPPVKLGVHGSGVHGSGVHGSGVHGSAACSSAPTSAADVDGASSAVLVTSHVARGRLTVLVLASWCART
jgi:hypothetical protein